MPNKFFVVASIILGLYVQPVCFGLEERSLTLFEKLDKDEIALIRILLDHPVTTTRFLNSVSDLNKILVSVQSDPLKATQYKLEGRPKGGALGMERMAIKFFGNNWHEVKLESLE